MRFFASKIFKETYYVIDSDVVVIVDRWKNGKFNMCRSVVDIKKVPENCIEIIPSGSFLEYVSDPLFEIELRRSYGR